MSAEAHRDIYKEPASLGLEESEGLFQQNGLVCGLMIACPVSGATGLRRGSSVAGTILQKEVPYRSDTAVRVRARAPLWARWEE